MGLVAGLNAHLLLLALAIVGLDLDRDRAASLKVAFKSRHVCALWIHNRTILGQGLELCATGHGQGCDQAKSLGFRHKIHSVAPFPFPRAEREGYAGVSPQVCDTSNNVTGLSRIGIPAR